MVDQGDARGRYWGWGNQPDWSPDGRRVAFSARGRIFSIGKSGRGLRRLTANQPGHSDPAWSPDGRYIAFPRSDYTFADDHGLYVMRSDGRGQRQVGHSRRRRLDPLDRGAVPRDLLIPEESIDQAETV